MHGAGKPERGIRRIIFSAVIAGELLVNSVLLAQGSLTTSDGLKLTLGATGAITSLQTNGAEHATSAIASGFLYREFPTSPGNAAPNGSFESGSTTPTSWSWATSSNGTWSWDTSTASSGTKSMKVSIPGTTSKRSPLLSSSQFTVAPNASYTVTCQVKTSSLTGKLSLYVLEENAAGVWVQRSVSSLSGTTSWAPLSMSFTTSPTATKAYFKAEIYSGHGTAWVDNVQMLDSFASRIPVAMGGTVTSDSGGLTQTASTNGLTLSARFTSVGSAIRVDATLTDTTGADRAIELSYRLPMKIAGWKWNQNFVTASTIADGTRYENLDTVFGSQTHSIYPFATVQSSASAVSLATPMVPQMNRFSYDTGWGFRVSWDLGLSISATKTRSKATVTFWIYSSDPKWGMRKAAEKYYTLNPGSFTSTSTMNGAWVLTDDKPLSSVPTWTDFGWALDEVGDDRDYDAAHGLIAMHYLDPSGWFRDFAQYAGGPQPSYSTLVSALTTDATSGTGTTVNGTPVKTMAQAVINSSPLDETGKYQVDDKSYFWYGNRMQIYPVDADPDVPAPSAWSMFTTYGVDNQLSGLDGIFLDDITSTFGNVENHRRPLWAYSSYPLTFSYATRKVMMFDGFSTAEFLSAFRTHVHGKGLHLFQSMNSGVYVWYAPYADIVGGEIAGGVDALEKAYVRRTLGYGRPWTNLLVNYTDSSAPSAATVLAYLRQALALGFFPGFAGEYWNSSTSYERDRSLVKKYIGLIRKTTAAGWKPVNYATPSTSEIYVERFDDQTSSVFYLTAQNSATGSRTYTMTVDGAGLGLGSGTITVKELVGGTTVASSRSGSNVVFSDTLAAGETALYEITDPSSTPATPDTETGPDNGSFELGSTTPTSWDLGKSSTSGNWTWDTTTASQGTKSAKLTVSGTTDEQSPYLKSATFVLGAKLAVTFHASTKTQSTGGTYSPKVWLVELDSAGNPLTDASGASIQHAINAPEGTTGWGKRSLSFTTDSRCAKAFVYANIYKGYGTFWVDDVSVD